MKCTLVFATLLFSTYATDSFANCVTPWGLSLQNGETVQAYLQSDPIRGQTCVSETRVCVGDVLNGSYFYSTCTEDLSCDGPLGPVANGSSVTAYRQPTASNGDVCESEIRFCQSGFLSGSYIFGSCSQLP